jgi:hypothetical protein
MRPAGAGARGGRARRDGGRPGAALAHARDLASVGSALRRGAARSGPGRMCFACCAPVRAIGTAHFEVACGTRAPGKLLHAAPHRRHARGLPPCLRCAAPDHRRACGAARARDAHPPTLFTDDLGRRSLAVGGMGRHPMNAPQRTAIPERARMRQLMCVRGHIIHFPTRRASSAVARRKGTPATRKNQRMYNNEQGKGANPSRGG